MPRVAVIADDGTEVAAFTDLADCISQDGMLWQWRDQVAPIALAAQIGEAIAKANLVDLGYETQAVHK